MKLLPSGSVALFPKSNAPFARLTRSICFDAFLSAKSRALPVFLESLEMLYLFVFSHYPMQNRFALLLEML
ncbi:hypothetical protein CQ052_10465 [Ochrobactrum sp. MYb15]|nr:hypothetical protein CWE02_12615 [Brucella pituitosa]PQZ48829.1 hypothetical protein CQZ90_09710 [Ochrobactrum sp. MYb19]PRA57966.1 hypothetical protein CQ062_04275 [Ochrobactrum sp. MYb68]PRA67353.1 hypothetical protein CQ053_08620 [Ochrobactrum sp. MYb18]PRA77687.1 hypothetical protein CQ049_10465 [Brucella thiophenivorans]PRA88618.1 hypothetical protein CQ054_00280 [Ochrobactrum sp. MYb29]PRA92363.1 hypothetical protein CQ051_09630 [Ochrobactrum sp. MYb14]PRA99697.1 hypothetical protei